VTPPLFSSRSETSGSEERDKRVEDVIPDAGRTRWPEGDVVTDDLPAEAVSQVNAVLILPVDADTVLAHARIELCEVKATVRTLLDPPRQPRAGWDGTAQTSVD
jgi:hypothetical protein